jgi:hypothetical protein
MYSVSLRAQSQAFWPPIHEYSSMDNHFFERPILNSPYSYPERHWELDSEGQPTQKIVATRRRAEFITPIPKPKKQKRKPNQDALIFDEGKGFPPKSNSTTQLQSLTIFAFR